MVALSLRGGDRMGRAEAEAWGRQHCTLQPH